MNRLAWLSWLLDALQDVGLWTYGQSVVRPPDTVCFHVQLPADFSRLHLADGIHPQVTHVSSSHSGCSITSDSGSSSLSDIYQVTTPFLARHLIFGERWSSSFVTNAIKM